MKKFILKNKSLITTVAILVIAVGLILTSTIGGTRAALQYFSETYAGHVEMYDIGVSLVENGTPVSYRNYITNSNGQWAMGKTALVQNMLAEAGDERLQIGKKYREELSVTNSGTINEYVRVKVFKYWTDAEGNKVTTLSPKLIKIDWANVGGAWTLASENDESAVLYYNSLLPSGASTAPFTEAITVYMDDTIKYAYTVEQSGNVIHYTYDYNGYKFQLEAEVDAVQDHNASDAMLSVWGTNAYAPY